MKNVDLRTVAGFGFEWSCFDQSKLDPSERVLLFDRYFSIFPWELLPSDGGIGTDIGCGSGRWALLVAPRVAQLHVIDASAEALEVAKRNLAGVTNVQFHYASVDNLPFADSSLDFAYSIGVLHHVPDTAAAIASVAHKLKRGAPFLVYLYYRFDNRPAWYSLLWQITDWVRRGVSRLPVPARYALSQVAAAVVYWPLARSCRLLDRFGMGSANWPLRYYASASFYVMRTDAFDRLCTSIEKRFTSAEVKLMLESAGLHDVRFSQFPPFWCAVGIK